MPERDLCAVNVGAPYLDGQGLCVIVAVGDYFHRIVPAVGEFIIGLAPADGRVKAVVEIIHLEIMVSARDGLEVCEHHSAVER